jgi:uncharacterized membrane protein YfcA
MLDSPYWFEVAVVCGLTAVGNILMGHFEAGTPKWRRLLKMVVVSALGVTISALAGRGWFFVFLGMLLALAALVHLWWLPRNGIHGWTGEPREKYYALRGWKMK